MIWFRAGVASGPAPPLIQRSADSPEYAARDMEKAVNRLLEESAAFNVRGEYSAALEKAKEAGKRERALCKHREKHGLSDQINVELTYAVCFNLANQYRLPPPLLPSHLSPLRLTPDRL
jgi:intraflagellar transport protein 88